MNHSEFQDTPTYNKPDSPSLSENRIKVWLELGLALLLTLAVGLAANFNLFLDSSESSGKDALQKAEAENEAANSNSVSADNDSAHSEEATETIADGQYPIMGSSTVTVEQMVSYFEANGGEYPSEILKEGGADSIEAFCQMYYDEATAEGVRPEVAFVQTMKETGWLQYGGDASIEQFNFAGLGTTGDGVAGNSYPDVRTGIRAQIQHLKAYATDDALTQACVDERYEYVTKGSSPYVEWLGQQENPEGCGWATAENYGYSIVEMISNLKQMGN